MAIISAFMSPTHPMFQKTAKTNHSSSDSPQWTQRAQFTMEKPGPSIILKILKAVLRGEKCLPFVLIRTL
jgi:hypothetical protein